MAWLWDSWEEYVEFIHPNVVDRPGAWRIACRQPWIETESHLLEAVRGLTKAQESLNSLGFSGSNHQHPPSDPAIANKAKNIVLNAIYAGENLLLYHKRLAKSDASYGFLHQHDLLEHWDRYAKTDRIAIEIDQLARDINELLQGYHDLVRAEEHFIIGDLDLPPMLESDFRLARNLFSVGFEEIGLLVAGRGLEGVLRKVAHDRKIKLEVKGKASPAFEADIYDLIEAMYQIRWKKKGIRLIPTETRALLHFLRTIRNGQAHSVVQGSRSAVNPRETAIVIAQTANKLWKEAISRAHITPTTVQKTW